MIKRLDEYKEYQDCLKEIEKQRVRCENLTKVFEEFEKVSLDLDNTLGIEKSGELPDFNKISKSKEKTKIAKREVDIANEKILSLEEYLKETILEIKNLRKIEIKKIGRAINRKVLKIIKDIAKLKKDYTQLEREIKSDFESLEIEGGYSAVIGADPRQIDFSTPMSYPTEFYLKRSKIYQSKEK